MSQKLIKIVFVGDGTVGKTCLLNCYSKSGLFGDDYVATIYDEEEFDISIDGEVREVKLIDTAGQEGYDRVRKLFYKDADCFVLCYDISQRETFTNVLEKWWPELKAVDSWPIPVVLVATKSDLRRSFDGPLISSAEGESMALKIHAYSFVENSAKDNVQINETIHDAVRAVLAGPVAIDDGSRCSMYFCCVARK